MTWILVGASTLVALLTLAACDRVGKSDPVEDGLLQVSRYDQAPRHLPRIAPEHETLDYWMSLLTPRHHMDEPLLDLPGIRAHNRALKERGEELGIAALEPDPPPEKLLQEVNTRLGWLHERLASGRLVPLSKDRLSAGALARFEPVDSLPTLTPRYHVVLDPVAVRCGPWMPPFFKPDRDLRFDRNQCSTLRPQELVQVLGPWPGDLLLIKSRYTLGWIQDKAPLSPPLEGAQLEAWRAGSRCQIALQGTLRTLEGEELSLPAKTRLPALDRRNCLVATAGGVHRVAQETLLSIPRPLTRGAVLAEALSYLQTPYGWGGMQAGLDCSRFLMELFASFGLKLPRTSSAIARAGTFSVDLTPMDGEEHRRRLIDEASNSGIVLLHLPGHVMLYLGRDTSGRSMVIHSLADYAPASEEPLQAQPERGNTLEGSPSSGKNGSRKGAESVLRAPRHRWVGRVVVSDLELGRGGSRGALISRIERLTVLGKLPPASWQGIAQVRQAAEVEVPLRCTPGQAASILVSPHTPSSQKPLRVVISTRQNPEPATLALFTGAGWHRVDAEVRRFGGPPYGYVAQIDDPRPGPWMAVFGDGERVLACKQFQVATQPGPSPTQPRLLPWPIRRGWDETAEDLYATFVESLFDHAWKGTPTWPDLSTLLRDPERNILHDHLEPEEDARLELQPDCADLPYFLRGYFAWKLGLPFAYRTCSRAQAGRPVRCGALTGKRATTVDERLWRVFYWYLHILKGEVHSSNPRTRPGDARSDFYPVELRRETLRPGTVFADPYGHTLIITRWKPQPLDGYGVLVAADAQPDGTVGLRTFWPGSFIFMPDTDVFGAGFKAHRPVQYRPDQGLSSMGNEAVGRRDPPLSEEQYGLTTGEFYDRMDRLINPLPLDPFSRMRSLVEALHSSVKRRVLSVAKGESYMQESGGVMSMPHGGDIFLTSGPWEDYSTPSRDLRLLIAIDLVARFPETVAANHGHYGVAPEGLDETLSEIRQALAKALGQRHISYQRSDGSSWTLTLADVVARKERLEMGYNPNDCVEVRWGASRQSREGATCKRRAPGHHQRRMAEYRPWFAARQRPLF